jgi:hypothetical protein
MRCSTRRHAADGAEREKVYMDAQVRIDEMCPWVYLYNEETLHGTRRTSRALTPAPVFPRSYERDFLGVPASHSKNYGVTIFETDESRSMGIFLCSCIF